MSLRAIYFQAVIYGDPVVCNETKNILLILRMSSNEYENYRHSTILSSKINKFNTNKNQTRERKYSVGDEGPLLPHPWDHHHDGRFGDGRACSYLG